MIPAQLFRPESLTRVVLCFTSHDPMSRNLNLMLRNTQVIGAGPTGVEFTGELTDLIGNDVPRLFPELIGLINLTVVSSGKVLPMFEEVRCGRRRGRLVLMCVWAAS